MTMSYVSWIVLGLIAGFIGSKIVNKSGQGFLLDVALGVIGAVVGGIIFTQLGMSGIQTGHFFYNLIVAVVGSVIVLWVYHAVMGRR